MPHAAVAVDNPKLLRLSRPLASAIALLGSTAVSLAIALAPVDPPPASAAVQDAVVAPVAFPPPALALPGPLPALHFTPAPPRPTAKVVAARRPQRFAGPPATVVARWDVDRETLLRLRVGLGRAIQAVLQPQTQSMLAVAVPADPDHAQPAPAEPPTTAEPDAADPADPEPPTADPPDPGDDGAATDPQGDEDAQTDDDEAEDEPEVDDDMRPLVGGKA